MNAAIRRATVFALALVLVAAGAALAQMDRFVPVTDEMLVNAADDPNNWLMWRRTYNHWGYSPLDQINRDNVASLQLVWARAMEPGLQETTPLVYNGIMYLVHSPDVVEALDATTGDLIWRYERELPEVYPPLAFANRNIAIYQDKIFLATADAALVALDARTGQVVWEQQVGDWTVGQHYSGGPMVVKGKVIAGMSGCYYINTRCFVTAHDPETGEELWRTYTIPAPGEPGDETWNGLPLELRYGGSAWMSASYDPELDLIFQGTAVPIQWTSAQRGTGDGDVLYTNSTLALDPDT
nr:pyrrolo-quinoline quinone [Bacillota bacterium]